MAKKQSSKAATTEPNQHALTIAALKRATSVVTADAKKANRGEVPELDADTYPIDFALRVNGDVIVAAATKTKPKAKPTFTDEELFACCFVQYVDAITGALSLLKSLKPDELKARVAAYRAARDAAAKKAKRWATPAGDDKAGAVTGNPSVRIDGSVGTRKVTLEVAKS